MGSLPDLAGADRVLLAAIRNADASVSMEDEAGRAAARELLAVLVDAQATLERRLRAWTSSHGGDEARFTPDSIIVYLEQAQAAIGYIQARLEGLTARAAEHAAFGAFARSAELITALEQRFTGIAVPVRIREAAWAQLQPSLLAQHATSVDRYGEAMIRRVMGEIAQGFGAGLSQGEMVDRLVALRGPQGPVSLRAVEVQPGLVVRLEEEDIPEGLFVRHRSWAWRIVRTEVANAQNAASLAGLEEAARGTDEEGGEDALPDMQKKIIAVMDQRTAEDSLWVHGQVRPLDGLFRDGAGREYLRPPARPHDRETIVPWRPHWPETAHSRPLDDAERTAMWDRNRRWQRQRQSRRAALKRRRARSHA